MKCMYNIQLIYEIKAHFDWIELRDPTHVLGGCWPERLMTVNFGVRYIILPNCRFVCMSHSDTTIRNKLFIKNKFKYWIYIAPLVLEFLHCCLDFKHIKRQILLLQL